MKFSYTWLAGLLKKIPSPKELGVILTSRSYQVESIEKKGSDFIFDIDILPNRMPDSAGHSGVAREIAIATKSQLVIPPVRVTEKDPAIQTRLAVFREAKNDVERYIATMLEGVTVKTSPRHIVKRLEACGLRPINTIVDATNYVLLETGHPVHAFDYDKIEGKRIAIRYAREGENIEMLDGGNVTLKKHHLVIADAKGPVAIAGIKGGKRAEIDRHTTRVVFETGVFDRARVRDASRELGIVTDASIRFSAGLPSEELDKVARRLLSLTQTIAGGVARKGMIDLRGIAKKTAPIVVRYARVCTMLGETISSKEIFDICNRLGCRVVRKNTDVCVVQPPPWRMDLAIEEDMIEEIGRVYGYAKISPTPLFAHLVHPEKNDTYRIADIVRERMRHFGFLEVLNYSLYSEKNAESQYGTSAHARLIHPISREYEYLRGTLRIGLLENIRAQYARSNTLKLFEQGTVFRIGKKEPEECSLLTAALASSSKSSELYFEAKGIAEGLLAELGLDDIWCEEVDGARLLWPFSPKEVMHPYRAAFIKSREKLLGVLYEVHPAVGMKMSVVMFEIHLSALITEVEEEHEFQPISRFPAVERDLAVLVPRDEQAEDVLEIIERAGGELLFDTDIFDYYEGGEIDSEKKSIAFRLVFQHDDRTLTEDEIHTVMQKITQALRKEDWEIRE